MEAVTPNSRVEIVAGKSESRCDLGNRLVERVVEAGEVCGLRENRLGRRDQLQRLRDVQRCEVSCSAQFVEDLHGDELVPDKLGTSMHHPVSDSHWTGMNVLANRGGEQAECVDLRFVNTFALYQRLSVGGTNVQGAVVAANAVGASGLQRLFIPRTLAIDAELQRRRAAVQREDQIVLLG